MSTAPTTPQVAGVDAYQHGYTTAISANASEDSADALRQAIANVAANVDIPAGALADWEEGVADALSDLDDEARRARMMFR